jgi:hypothetical protein
LRVDICLGIIVVARSHLRLLPLGGYLSCQ